MWLEVNLCREFDWHVACRMPSEGSLIEELRFNLLGGTKVSHKLLIGLAVTVLAVAGSACSATDNVNANANANANANTTVATTTRLGADNSEISTTIDANGVKTEA